MVFVVLKWMHPSHKQKEVTEIFQKLENPAGSVGETVVFAVKGSKRGYIGQIFMKVVQEEVGKALADAARILGSYAEIEGYEYDIEVWADVTEIEGS